MIVDWNLNYLYKNDQEWERSFEILEEEITNIKKLGNKFYQTSDVFLEYLQRKIDIDQEIESIYCYAKRHLDIDSTLTEYQEKMNRALEIYSKTLEMNQKLESAILQNISIIKKYLQKKEYQPYIRYLQEIIRKEKHTPKDQTSAIFLNQYSKPMYQLKDIYQTLLNQDRKYVTITINDEEIEVNTKNYNKLCLSENQETRKLAYLAYTRSFSNLANTISKIYLAKVSNDILLAKNENYSSLLDKKLFELELPKKIVKNLIDTIHIHLPVMHDFIKMKKTYLKLTEFHIYDNQVSPIETPTMKYELEEAVEIIKQSLSVLKEDYIKMIERAFQEGWIDIYPKENKRKMSFTCISYNGVPYVLVNYTKSLQSIRTLAHELGHAINTELSKKNGFIYFEVSYFLTEVASKVNEILFNEYILNHVKSKEEKVFILNDIIKNIGNTLFGQTMLTEFEYLVINKLENKEPIDVNTLNNLYYNLSKKYNGQELTYDEEIKYDWLKIPHFILQESYYVYQYAIGLSIAYDIATKILKNENHMIEKYLQFLSLGNSVSIIEALKVVDIDLQKGDYITRTVEMLKEKMVELEKIQKEIKEDK